MPAIIQTTAVEVRRRNSGSLLSAQASMWLIDRVVEIESFLKARHYIVLPRKPTILIVLYLTKSSCNLDIINSPCFGFA